MKAAYPEDRQAELTYAHHSKKHTEQGQLLVLGHSIRFPPESDMLPQPLNPYSGMAGGPSSEIEPQSAKSETAEAAALPQPPGYLNG